MQLHRATPALRAVADHVDLGAGGAPSFIAGFRELTGYGGTIYTDPSRAVYRAAELRRGLSTVLTLGTLRRSIGAFRRGYRQGRTQGDALQQGGTLVIAPDGRILLHHVSAGPGDHALEPAILDAVATVRP